MDWWQVILIILLFIVVGLGIGYLAGYLIITRLLKKPFVVAFPGQRSAISSTRQGYIPFTSGFMSRLTQIITTIKPKKEKQVNTATYDTPQITQTIKETPKTSTSEFYAEPVKEKERKIIDQQTTESIQKEAEEARRARIVRERERRKAEQIAQEISKREAEVTRKARELEEITRKEAEQQARESAQKEIEEKARKEAEEQAREIPKEEAEAVKQASETDKEKPEKVPLGGENIKIDTPGLLAEVENNRMLANEPWTGKLIPFQTYVWNTNPAELHTLPASLREEMAQAYSDIQLANSIVWLATELGRRSPSLDENYMKLCINIAARLETIEPLLKQSINK